MGSFGAFEWVIVALVVLLLFGAKKIPELARGLGQGINEFRKASSEIKKEIDQGTEDIKESVSETPKAHKSEAGKSNKKEQGKENTGQKSQEKEKAGTENEQSD